MNQRPSLKQLLTEIRACRHCEKHLEFGPRPILALSRQSRILIIGQAPGMRVHQSGIAWNDASGNRLREWMGISKQDFYNENIVAIVPMGFCYPGRGKSGDLPPRPECAELWHDRVMRPVGQSRADVACWNVCSVPYVGRQSKKDTNRNGRELERVSATILAASSSQPSQCSMVQKQSVV